MLQLVLRRELVFRRVATTLLEPSSNMGCSFDNAFVDETREGKPSSLIVTLGSHRTVTRRRSIATGRWAGGVARSTSLKAQSKFKCSWAVIPSKGTRCSTCCTTPRKSFRVVTSPGTALPNAHDNIEMCCMEHSAHLLLSPSTPTTFDCNRVP